MSYKAQKENCVMVSKITREENRNFRKTSSVKDKCVSEADSLKYLNHVTRSRESRERHTTNSINDAKKQWGTQCALPMTPKPECEVLGLSHGCASSCGK